MVPTPLTPYWKLLQKVKAPVIVQFSNGGAAFIAGKGVKTDVPQGAAILGAISGAHHVHQMAEHYGVPVILHTDHCAKKLLPWIDGLLDAGEKHFAATGKPLFSSHMIDLSEESLHENIEICSKYRAHGQNGHDPGNRTGLHRW